MKRMICLLLLLLLPCTSCAEITKQEAVDICCSFFEAMCGVELGDLRDARELYVQRSRVYVPDVGYPPDAGYLWAVSFKDTKLPIEGSVNIHEETGEILQWYCVDKKARASYKNMRPTGEQVQLEDVQAMVMQYFEACTGIAPDPLDDEVLIKANFGMSDAWVDAHYLKGLEVVPSWCMVLYFWPEGQDAYWEATRIIDAATGEIMFQCCAEKMRSLPEYELIVDLSRKKP